MTTHPYEDRPTAVHAEPPYELGEVITYHSGVWKMAVILEGTGRLVRWAMTGDDEIFFHAGTVLQTVPPRGWDYIVQPDGTLDYRASK